MFGRLRCQHGPVCKLCHRPALTDQQRMRARQIGRGDQYVEVTHRSQAGQWIGQMRQCEPLEKAMRDPRLRQQGGYPRRLARDGKPALLRPSQN